MQAVQEEKESKWDPLPYQDDLSRNQALIRAIIGGNRTGKTEWGAHETFWFITGTHPYRALVPPIEAWVATPSFDIQLEATQPKLLKYLKQEDIQNVEYLRGNIMSRIHLKNGTDVAFKSYEQGSEKFQSAGKRLIWFDEEPPHDIWNECLVRQEAGIPLDIILTMTPVNGMTWVYDELWQQAAAKGIAIKTPSWRDNWHLTTDQTNNMRTQLTAEELEVREMGHFVRKVGLVLPWWRRDIHLVDLSTFNPQGCTVWVGIDFGFTSSALAVVFVAIKGEELYLFDGIYAYGMTTDVLARTIKEKLGKTFVNGWVGDSAQAEDLAELRKYGIPVNGVKKEVSTIKENWDDFRARRLKEMGQVNPLTNRPRLFVAQHLSAAVDGRECNWFANEAENLRWKTIRTADGSQARPIWGDGHKDAIDALSYVIVSLPETIQAKFGNQAMEQLARQVPKENLFDDSGFY